MSSPEQILQKTFGFNDFRPGQREIIDLLMGGQNALARTFIALYRNSAILPSTSRVGHAN
jgi:hypothetical protein